MLKRMIVKMKCISEVLKRMTVKMKCISEVLKRMIVKMKCIKERSVEMNDSQDETY